MRVVLVLALLVLAVPARAERLTVVELFTSQGCSSCPPADELLAELARSEPGLLALDLHVTYWDRGGWKDPFSFAAITQRQRAFGHTLGLDTIYTPQIVVDGRREAVGSDRQGVRRAIQAARAAAGPVVELSLAADAGGVRLHAGAGQGRGTLLLVGFDRQHMTPVRGGENGGRTLTEVNVVRAMGPVGAWAGMPVDLVVKRPEGERVAVLLQGDDGKVLAAVALP